MGAGAEWGRAISEGFFLKMQIFKMKQQTRFCCSPDVNFTLKYESHRYKVNHLKPLSTILFNHKMVLGSELTQSSKSKISLYANTAFEMFRNNLVMLNADNFKSFLQRCHLVHLRGELESICPMGGD